MNTFLFAWNPKKWDWTNLKSNITQIEQTGRAIEQWSVSNKKICPGDRAFLMRLGVKPKGIMASGFVTTDPFLSKHWSEDKLISRVMIDFDVIINPQTESLLSLEKLNSEKLAQKTWTPQSSGIMINADVAHELEALWFEHLTRDVARITQSYSPDSNDSTVYTEGTPNLVIATTYERNPFARKLCIDNYGPVCQVCKFDFESKYGELGKGFIHVHHLRKIANIGEEYKVDPIKDLRPVCPNCHAMIHKRKEPYSIEEIKERIKKNCST